MHSIPFIQTVSARRTAPECQNKFGLLEIASENSFMSAQGCNNRVKKLITAFQQFGQPNFNLTELVGGFRNQSATSAEVYLKKSAENTFYKYEITEEPSGVCLRELFHHHAIDVFVPSVSLEDIRAVVTARELFGEINKDQDYQGIEQDFVAIFRIYADLKTEVDKNEFIYLASDVDKVQSYFAMHPQHLQTLAAIFLRGTETEKLQSDHKFGKYTVFCANLSFSNMEENRGLSAQYDQAVVAVKTLYMALREIHL